MPEPTARDYFQEHQDRQELAKAMSMLGSFIAKYSVLDPISASVLAMQIYVNGESSGCVSAARAARLLKEAHNA